MEMDLLIPDEVSEELEAVKRQSLLDEGAIPSTRLPLRKEAYGPANAVDTGGSG